MTAATEYVESSTKEALDSIVNFENWLLGHIDEIGTDLATPDLVASMEYRALGFTSDEADQHWRNASRVVRYRRVIGTVEQRREMREHLANCEQRLANESPKLNEQIDALKKKLAECERQRDGLSKDVSTASKRIEESQTALQDLRNLGTPRWLYAEHSRLHERIRNTERLHFGDGFSRDDLRANELRELINMKPPTEQDDLAHIDRKWGHMFAIVDATDVGSDRTYRLNSSGFAEWKKWLKSKLPEIEQKEAQYQAEIAPLRAMQDQLQQIYYSDLLEPPAQDVVQDSASQTALPTMEQG